MPGPEHVVCGVEALPEHPPHKDHYVYDPKPPTAKLPLISRQAFKACLKACDDNCHWCLLPSFLHETRPLGTNMEYWKRLPKRKSELKLYQRNPDRVAFGIVADHDISFAGLIAYHVLAFSPTLWFWAYRLEYHPGDYQNASVPFFALMALITPFWAIFIWRFDRT
jgi:hypothetical protein